MAGFFEDIGEFFTGNKQRDAEGRQKQIAEEAERVNTENANQQGALADAAIAQAAQYDKGAAESMGANAADYLRRENEATAPIAGQEAEQAATGAARQALMAARTAGVNRGASAIQGAQVAGNGYYDNLRSAMDRARNRYQSATQQFANRGDQLATRGQQYGVAKQGYLDRKFGGQQYGAESALKNAQGSAQAGGGTVNGIVSGLKTTMDEAGKAMMVAASDKNLKDDVKPSKATLEELVKKVRPVSFRYKTGVDGEDPNKQREGVLAQDLEKTSMKDNVIEGPQGKMVDTNQQTMSNLNLITKMAQRLFDLEDELKTMKGGAK